MTATAAERAVLVRRWERAAELPLMIAAVVFLAAYAVPILHPDLPSWLLNLSRSLSWITWGIFVVDILVRLFLADERVRYLVRHWYDVLVLALPLLRPLRLLRLIPLLSVLNRRATIRLRGRVGIYVAGGASLLAFCAALAVLDAERSSPDANISDFGDAIWWAVTTMTTVGYGDHYPVTAAGRLVAFGLMIGGIALLGTVTATLASWLVETVAAEKEAGRGLTGHGPAVGGQDRPTRRREHAWPYCRIGHSWIFFLKMLPITIKIRLAASPMITVTRLALVLRRRSCSWTLFSVAGCLMDVSGWFRQRGLDALSST
jgi:voltage-gated potassium channel